MTSEAPRKPLRGPLEALEALREGRLQARIAQIRKRRLDDLATAQAEVETARAHFPEHRTRID